MFQEVDERISALTKQVEALKSDHRPEETRRAIVLCVDCISELRKAAGTLEQRIATIGG